MTPWKFYLGIAIILLIIYGIVSLFVAFPGQCFAVIIGMIGTALIICACRAIENFRKDLG